jgi:hypothetical protein
MLYLYIIILLFIVFYKFKENFTQTVSTYTKYLLTDINNNLYYLVPLSLLDNNIKLYLLENNLINDKYNIIDRLKLGITNNIELNKKPLNDIIYAINVNDIQLFVSDNKKLLFNSNNEPFIYNGNNYNIISNSDMYILDSYISISNYTYPFNINNNLLQNKFNINNFNNYNFELNQININNNNIYQIKLSNENTNIKLINKKD